MTETERNRPNGKTLRRWWGVNAEYVVSRIQLFFARYGFNDVFWSSERPMHFSMCRRRNELLETVTCEGKELFFSTGFSVSSEPALAIAQSLQLWECSTALRRLSLVWPNSMESWPLLYTSMTSLMYHIREIQPAPVFFVSNESNLNDVLDSFEVAYQEITPFVFDVFEDAEVVADFLMGVRAPDPVRFAVSKKSDLYTGVARESVFLNASLLYATLGKVSDALNAIQQYENVTHASFARRQLIEEQYDDNLCEAARIAEYLRDQ